ncbi:hypothetical protein BJX62DRAFT_213853 [Aspergillus germanicus]
MHHFATETYQTLCVSESEARTWQVLVPRLALRHRYLMHGILSLASLHLATTREGSEARMYIDAGLSYHSLSLEPFRIAIGNLTPENCEAAFAQSVVTTAISLALPQLTPHKAVPASPSEPTSSTRMTDHILTIFKLLQGVKRILTLNKQHITLQLFTQGPFWRKEVTTTLDASTIAAFGRLAHLYQIEPKSESNIQSAEKTLMTANVITYLRHCFMKFACAPQVDPAPVLAWLGAVDVEFVESLRRRERVPLLVLAFWGVLLFGLDGERWWARGAGRALVDEILGFVEGEKISQTEEWKECLGWVMRRIGVDVR